MELSSAAILGKLALTRYRLAIGLMIASGFAGLGYQIIWTQQTSLWLGHEAAAVIAVVTAFFGGISAGAWLLAAPIERSPWPARWYVVCELTIAGWSVVLALLMAPLAEAMLQLTGSQPSPGWQWSVAFGGTFFMLLPATAAMGATLPAMARVLAPLCKADSGIASLYAANTLGAVLGVLATAFWLLPWLGLAHTAYICIALTLFCAFAVLKLFSSPQMPAISSVSTGATDANLIADSAGRQLLPILFCTGLLGIGYEILVVRVLSQVAENTVYTFAILLAVYLVGTASGAAGYARWQRNKNWAADDGKGITLRLLQWLAAACLLGVICLGEAAAVKRTALELLGSSMTAALSAEAIIAMTAFLVPTIMMGALFSHLCTAAKISGVKFSHCLGINTLGAALAPLLFGVLLVPVIGPQRALLLVAGGYLLLSMVGPDIATWQTKLSRPLLAMTACVLFALALWGGTLRFVEVEADGRLISYQEGAAAAVSVVEDARGVARLHINNRQQEGSSATLLADARQALIPLLLHPDPRRALFLGLGTGVTATSATYDPQLKVDAVELLPEVIAASAYFTGTVNGASGPQPNPRLTLITADARRFVRAREQPSAQRSPDPHYDFIVADNFHPARSGSAALYTVEHFAAVRDQLADDGFFCQWLPLHQLDLPTLRSIVQSYVSVYPNSFAVLATNSLDTPVVGLIARRDGQRFDLAAIHSRLQSSASTMLRAPAEFGLADDFALLGSFIAGPRALAKFAGAAQLNTDDHPVVATLAPRITYAADSLPRDRLSSLLREVDIGTDELLAAPVNNEWARRLAAYWQARDQFINAGRNVQAAADPRQMLAQVREPLLAVLRVSPDFRPAYDPLLRIAVALENTDAAMATSLLNELQQLQPLRPEAGRAIQAIKELSRTR